MEHRWNLRQTVKARALVNSTMSGNRHVRILDISAGGARIELGDGELSSNLHVELVFVVNDRGVLRMHRIPALVAWAAGNVVGLMFYETDQEAVGAALLAAWTSDPEGSPGNRLEGSDDPALASG
ncbi:MAG: PilZ domain-containing protein [Pseudomonadota bacterium]|nr:PilZ domain-containing protein [Pseudomonadota bacterium]